VKAIITGVGWVNGAGAGRGRQALFSHGGIKGLPKLSGKNFFHRPFPRFARMDTYSRVGVAALALALRDAGLDEWTQPREIAVIASTVYGSTGANETYYDTVIPEGGRLASPSLFAYTLPNVYLGEAAIQFGLTGPGFVLCESSSSGLRGLSRAIDGVGGEEYATFVTGTCDVNPTPALAAMGEISPGALFFVLQGSLPGHGLSYGTLTQDESASIHFEGVRVENLDMLALMCTTRIHGKKGNGEDI
jgi:3-oxoacyl-[acyl-carrier-protein] synthase II